MDEVCRRCKITKPTPLTERLVDFARAMQDNFSADLSAMLRDMEHISDKHYRRLINEAHQTELSAPVTALLQAGMRRGELRQGDSALYAWAFFGLVNTFIQSRHGLNQDDETLARLLVDLFLRGAGVNSPG
jgi:hypothetical protein